MIWNGNECGRNSGDENVKAAIPSTGYDTSKTTGECTIKMCLQCK
jgi:hypothetical protein